jgi:hypothetical protein
VLVARGVPEWDEQREESVNDQLGTIEHIIRKGIAIESGAQWIY